MECKARNPCKNELYQNQSAEGTTEYSRKDAKGRKASVTDSIKVPNSDTVYLKSVDRCPKITSWQRHTKKRRLKVETSFVETAGVEPATPCL